MEYKAKNQLDVSCFMLQVTRNCHGVTTLQWLIFSGAFGLIALLAMFGVSVSRGAARDAIRVANVKELQAALELFYNDQNAYPKAPDDGLFLGAPSILCLDAEGFKAACSGKVYMSFIPTAPEPADKQCDAATNAYRYYSDGAQYVLTFCTGRAVGNLSQGVHQASLGKIE